MSVTKIDERILDTNNRFHDYCMERKIRNPFQNTEEIGQAAQKDIYLCLEHTFRLWDFHFWMPWEQFSQYFKYENYADTSIYLPCDCIDRQCAMTCAYFGGKCPREKTEIQTPKLLGFEGRWKFHDDDV